MGAEEPASKRAKHEHGPTDAAAAFAIPTADEPLHQSAVASALQQLYKVYKVEYYSLLEQLRSQTHQPQGSSAGVTAPDTKPAAAQGGGSVRQQLRGNNAPDTNAHPVTAGDGGSSCNMDMQQQYGDDVCGYGSDTDPPTCTEAAAVAGDAGSVTPGVGKEQVAQWQQRFSSVEGQVMKLEQVACGAALQYMDAQGVLACLSGINGCYLIRRTAVNLGRYSDAAGEVDIDLALEAAAAPAAAGAAPSVPPTPAAAADEAGTAAAVAGAGAAAAPTSSGGAAAAAGGAVAGGGGLGAAQQVSRLQAQLALQDNGSWQITNLGRRAISVDGAKVLQGHSAPLRQLSLVQVAAINLLFLVNGLAAQRLLARSHSLNM